MRLDDACEKRDMKKWDRMESLLDKYGIKPLVGVIPHCEDPMMNKYEYDDEFWEKVNNWKNKGWIIAMHGYNHVYCTSSGGINPVNNRSEFADVPEEIQRKKIQKGIMIFRSHGIEPRVFFAPSHTFDENTIKILLELTSIYIISDTIANKAYKEKGILFVPQQTGKVRKLPLNTVTFCYHPNIMSDNDFKKLETFLEKERVKFSIITDIHVSNKKGIYDKFLSKVYFWKRKLR